MTIFRLGRHLQKISPDIGPLLARYWKYPVAVTGIAGTAVAANQAYGTHASELESEYMRNRLGTPGGKYVYASEGTRTFLENEYVKQAAPQDYAPPTWAASWKQGLSQGLGTGAAAAGMLVLMDILRKAGRGLSQKMLYDQKRREMLRLLLATDPILASFDENNPGILLQVYASMVATAPTLSLDRNAAKSFLREAVQTHGSVNYLTIKQLAETEKALSAAKGDESPLGF